MHKEYTMRNNKSILDNSGVSQRYAKNHIQFFQAFQADPNGIQYINTGTIANDFAGSLIDAYLTGATIPVAELANLWYNHKGRSAKRTYENAYRFVLDRSERTGYVAAINGMVQRWCTQNDFPNPEQFVMVSPTEMRWMAV